MAGVDEGNGAWFFLFQPILFWFFSGQLCAYIRCRICRVRSFLLPARRLLTFLRLLLDGFFCGFPRGFFRGFFCGFLFRFFVLLIP